MPFSIATVHVLKEWHSTVLKTLPAEFWSSWFIGYNEVGLPPKDLPGDAPWLTLRPLMG